MSECFSLFIVRTLPAKVSVSISENELLSELAKHAVFHVPSNSVVELELSEVEESSSEELSSEDVVEVTVLVVASSSDDPHEVTSTAMLIIKTKYVSNFFTFRLLQNVDIKLKLHIFQQKLANSLHQNLYNTLNKYFYLCNNIPIL